MSHDGLFLLLIWFGLMPLSTMCQLYHGCQYYWRRKHGVPEFFFTDLLKQYMYMTIQYLNKKLKNLSHRQKSLQFNFQNQIQILCLQCLTAQEVNIRETILFGVQYISLLKEILACIVVNRLVYTCYILQLENSYLLKHHNYTSFGPCI